ncbi:hypothetical protein ABN028_20000 [Actinopolymorpha sp. B17G11]|uniref:hypothetical protein n=1 Tax=Actinopolymorpha sp. B17G11 TaxID=3160861 RepID=UPI0032E3D954
MTALTAAVAPTVPTTDALLAPSAGLVTAAGIALYAVRTWKEGRQIDLEGEKRRREDAEKRAEAAEKEKANEIATLRSELERVRQEVQQLREQRDADLNQLRVRRESDLRENYRLRELLAAHGIDPDEKKAAP